MFTLGILSVGYLAWGAQRGVLSVGYSAWGAQRGVAGCSAWGAQRGVLSVKYDIEHALEIIENLP